MKTLVENMLLYAVFVVFLNSWCWNAFMMCLWLVSFVSGAICSTMMMLNCLPLMPSVIDINSGDVFVIVNRFSNLFDFTFSTLALGVRKAEKIQFYWVS